MHTIRFTINSWRLNSQLSAAFSQHWATFCIIPSLILSQLRGKVTIISHRSNSDTPRACRKQGASYRVHATILRSYVAEAELQREIFISHNGDAVMSGHITIHDDGEPNSMYSEFTIGNFNAFHRGFHTPEISVSRSDNRRQKWEFRDILDPGNTAWQTDEVFECFGKVTLSHPEMAQRIYDALSYPARR